MAYGTGYVGGYADLSDLFIVPTVYGSANARLTLEPTATVLSQYWNGSDDDDLWRRLDAVRSPKVFVYVDGTWVARSEVTIDDVEQGRRVVGGG